MNSSAQPPPCATDGIRKTSSNTCANTRLWIVSSNTESAPLLRSAHPFGLPVGRLCRSARLLKPRATSIPPASHLRDQRQPAPRPRPQRTTRRKPRPIQPHTRRHPRGHMHRTQHHGNLLSRNHPPPRLPPNHVNCFPDRSGSLNLYQKPLAFGF